MNDKSFFDTNLIVYLFDESEKEKQKRVNAVFLKCINKKNAFISVQVINEFIVIGTKKIKNPISFPEIEKRIRFLENRCYVSNLIIQDSYEAINIKNKYQLSFWDSFCLPIFMYFSSNKRYNFVKSLQKKAFRKTGRLLILYNYKQLSCCGLDLNQHKVTLTSPSS